MKRASDFVFLSHPKKTDTLCQTEAEPAIEGNEIVGWTPRTWLGPMKRFSVWRSLPTPRITASYSYRVMQSLRRDKHIQRRCTWNVKWFGLDLPQTPGTPCFLRRIGQDQRQVYLNEGFKRVLLLWIKWNFNKRWMILREDWAPFHAAKTTLAYCDAHFPVYWGKDRWPWNSRDLKIFPVWWCLQYKVPPRYRESAASVKASLVVFGQSEFVSLLMRHPVRSLSAYPSQNGTNKKLTV